jgi:hypothetical protein
MNVRNVLQFSSVDATAGSNKYSTYTISVISLCSSSFSHLPRIIFLLRVLPPHILLGIIIQGALGKEFRLDSGGIDGYIFNDTHKIAHNVFSTTWFTNLTKIIIHFGSSRKVGVAHIQIVGGSAFDGCWWSWWFGCRRHGNTVLTKKESAKEGRRRANKFKFLAVNRSKKQKEVLMGERCER